MLFTVSREGMVSRPEVIFVETRTKVRYRAVKTPGGVVVFVSRSAAEREGLDPLLIDALRELERVTGKKTCLEA